jgi:N-acetylneuraminate synthase/N,N'-diacetyllegionaminate synthase
MNPIRIGDREVGTGRSVFVIAEAGVNHNGRLDLAERLVDIAADAGADAVKFQTFDPKLLATPAAAKAEYQRETTGEGGSQLEMLQALVLPRDAHVQLQKRARDRGLIFLSTPFDEPSADFLETLDVPAFKVSSGDLTNVFLLKHLAAKQRPLLLSTGMATLDEVRAAVAVVQPQPVALFHCVSNYPAEPADCNLRAIATLRTATGVPVGWSDHTHGIDVTVAAVALGAELVEKHFTIDRTLPGPDHRASLEPHELAAMVRGIRNAEAALGDGEKRPRPSELAVATVARRSLCYREDLAAGAVVAEHHFIALRPGTGIATTEVGKLVGRRLARAVRHAQLVALDDFEV